MGTPEEKARKRMRIRSKVTKDARKPKYHQRLEQENKIKNKSVDVTKLTHAQLVKLISEKENQDDNKE